MGFSSCMPVPVVPRKRRSPEEPTGEHADRLGVATTWRGSVGGLPRSRSAGFLPPYHAAADCPKPERRLFPRDGRTLGRTEAGRARGEVWGVSGPSGAMAPRHALTGRARATTPWGAFCPRARCQVCSRSLRSCWSRGRRVVGVWTARPYFGKPLGGAGVGPITSLRHRRNAVRRPWVGGIAPLEGHTMGRPGVLRTPSRNLRARRFFRGDYSAALGST